jgi:hypothetical protein
MSLVVGNVTFTGKAPGAAEIAAKVEAISGLPVVFTNQESDFAYLYDFHGHLAFACAPEERLEISCYRPGEAKKYYNQMFDGYEDLPTAKYAQGLNEAAGTQVVYLRSYLGLEPTLLMATTIALESLGGRPYDPITEEVRREFGVPITEKQLEERRTKLRKQFERAAFWHTWLLPLHLLLLFLHLLVAFVMLPWKLWKVWGTYKEVAAKRAHREFMKSIPERLEFVETAPEAFPRLDQNTLMSYSDGLEALGFVRAIDYCVLTDTMPKAKGFARLFVHPFEHCIAEIAQVFPENMTAEMRCTLGSLMEGGGGISTTDREPYALMYIWRRPNYLWSCHKAMSLRELWAEHVRRRHIVARRLGVNLVKYLSAQQYFEHERQALAARKAVLLAKNDKTIQAEMQEFQNTPINEWCGEPPIYFD